MKSLIILQTMVSVCFFSFYGCCKRIGYLLIGYSQCLCEGDLTTRKITNSDQKTSH